MFNKKDYEVLRLKVNKDARYVLFIKHAQRISNDRVFQLNLQDLSENYAMMSKYNASGAGYE